MFWFLTLGHSGIRCLSAENPYSHQYSHFRCFNFNRMELHNMDELPLYSQGNVTTPLVGIWWPEYDFNLILVFSKVALISKIFNYFGGKDITFCTSAKLDSFVLDCRLLVPLAQLYFFNWKKYIQPIALYLYLLTFFEDVCSFPGIGLWMATLAKWFNFWHSFGTLLSICETKHYFVVAICDTLYSVLLSLSMFIFFLLLSEFMFFSNGFQLCLSAFDIPYVLAMSIAFSKVDSKPSYMSFSLVLLEWHPMTTLSRTISSGSP